MKIKLSIILLLLVGSSFAQNNSRNEVKSIVDSFIEAHNKQDLVLIGKLLDQNVGFMTIFYDGAKSILAAESQEMYLQSIENNSGKSIREQILNYRISSSDVMATVWGEYNYFINNKLAHCGEKAFQLYKTAKGWKIIQITETRYNRARCKTSTPSKFDKKATLINFLDNWHKDASEAKFDEYFNAIAEDGVYIGTDPDEYWTKQEFKKWAKSYFDEDTAWHFETIKRNIFFSDDEDLAWFSEKLKTSMGVCQATGVAELTRNGWKIEYYQLSVTIPNELLKDFLKLKSKTN